jgi:hypothetical protein
LPFSAGKINPERDRVGQAFRPAGSPGFQPGVSKPATGKSPETQTRMSAYAVQRSFDNRIEAGKFPELMKCNPLRMVLEWALIMSLLLSLYFFIRFFDDSREIRKLTPQFQQSMAVMQNNRVMMSNLIITCDEYARNNPDFKRVLESLRTQPPSAPKPAGK